MTNYNVLTILRYNNCEYGRLKENLYLLMSITCQSTHLTLKRTQGPRFSLLSLASRFFLLLLTPSFCSLSTIISIFFFNLFSLFKFFVSLFALISRSFLLFFIKHNCNFFFFNLFSYVSFLPLTSHSFLSFLALVSHFFLLFLMKHNCNFFFMKKK